MIGIRVSPWLSDSAVNFLSNVFDWWPCYATEYSLDSTTVLEFGSGSSTFWFLQQGFNVVTVETDPFYQDLLWQMSNLFDVSCTVGNSIPPFLTQQNKSDLTSTPPYRYENSYISMLTDHILIQLL
ncbi:hypothetical protein [Limnospira fusiformis]|uniref:hypothetical protein n=1 Tax=Limnospira fusiformis TaxID=54297 RepID=UPI0034E08FEE